MSKLRDEAEAIIAALPNEYEKWAAEAGEQAEIVLILLDALEEMCAGCDIDCDDLNLICDHHRLKRAIKQAEEV